LELEKKERKRQVMKTKDLSSIAEKFATVTPQRADQYAMGVQNPKTDWAQATAAAEENYKSAVTAAASAGRFGKGVRKAGSAKWQKGATEKGPTRFAAGVSLAKDAFQTGFAPFHQVLAALTLPPRFSRRDPRNLNRVGAVATALGKAKEALLK
jgi:hypothetical protein